MANSAKVQNFEGVPNGPRIALVESSAFRGFASQGGKSVFIISTRCCMLLQDVIVFVKSMISASGDDYASSLGDL